MAAFKPIDPKRDEFRLYLERNGVIEALTKAFVQLIKTPERPEDPIAFLRSNLGDARQQADSAAHLRTELNEARSQIENLRELITRIDPFALSDGERTQESGVSATTVQRSESINGVTSNNEVTQEKLPTATTSTATNVPAAAKDTAAIEDAPTLDGNHHTAEHSHSVEVTTVAAANASLAAEDDKDNNVQA